jgi:hypothetical protein
MFSKSLVALVAVSLVAAACNSPSADPPAPAAHPAVTAAPNEGPKAERAEQVAPKATQAPPAEAKPAAKQPPAPSADSALKVKRFVVASAVEDREPVEVESVAVGELPLFAFAELENDGGTGRVTITFERDGSSQKAGHVSLEVPGEMQRWRTWGKTNLIDKAGRWSAVLRDENGNELARKPFDVTS